MKQKLKLNFNKYKRYFEYHIRWQFSGIVAIPIMYYIASFDFELWQNIMLSQFLGAIIFWKIDSWLFNHKIKNENK